MVKRYLISLVFSLLCLLILILIAYVRDVGWLKESGYYL